jgi:hypothetical protein
MGAMKQNRGADGPLADIQPDRVPVRVGDANVVDTDLTTFHGLST